MVGCLMMGKLPVMAGAGVAGNQTGLIRVPAHHLAALCCSPFEIAVWDGLDEPISAKRVMRYIHEGDTLPPEHGLMGHELDSLSDHERRVAWLYLNAEGWQPVTTEAGVVDECVMLSDGHHRLAAALLLAIKLTVEVKIGVRSHITNFLDGAGGQWLNYPSTEVFGVGVFPADASNNHASVKIYGGNGRCWVEDIMTGECVARYGHKLWTVSTVSAGELPGTTDDPPKQHRICPEGAPKDEHEKSFTAACQSAFGERNNTLGAYIRDVLATPFIA